MKIVLIALLLLIAPTAAFAQTNPKDTITVSPSILRLDLQEDDPEVILTYNNTTAQTVEITFTASDFSELEHGYKPAFLEGKDAKNYKYALSGWIDFDKKNILVSPHTREQVKVFINKEKLTPGGHYTAIQAHVINKNPTGNVELQGILSSLLFVRTATGREHEEAKIESFSPVSEWFVFPQDFVLRFHNKGDTDVIPYGLVEIKDPFGRLVAKGILNEGSLIALPESIRRYDIPLIQQTRLLTPGLYTAHFTGHFGKTNKQIKTSIQFFSQGSVPIIWIGGGIILLVFIWLRLRPKEKSNNLR